MCAGIALYWCDRVSDACVFHGECAPLLCQAKHMPAQDQLLVYVAVEFAAILFPEDEMFTLGSGGGPNDNPIYTNPTLSYGTAYTYFVICLLDTTPESLNVCVIEPDHWCTHCLRFCCFVCYCVVCGFVCFSQDPLAQRVTNYTLAGYSSFGGVYLTPAGPTDVTVIAVAICVVLIVVGIIVAMVIAVVVFCKKWSKYRYVCANPLHPSMTVHVCQVLICSSCAGCALCWVCTVLVYSSVLCSLLAVQARPFSAQPSV